MSQQAGRCERCGAEVASGEGLCATCRASSVAAAGPGRPVKQEDTPTLRIGTPVGERKPPPGARRSLFYAIGLMVLLLVLAVYLFLNPLQKPVQTQQIPYPPPPAAGPAPGPAGTVHPIAPAEQPSPVQQMTEPQQQVEESLQEPAPAKKKGQRQAKQARKVPSVRADDARGGGEATQNPPPTTPARSEGKRERSPGNQWRIDNIRPSN